MQVENALMKEKSVTSALFVIFIIILDTKAEKIGIQV
jgi:hypothetical protein